MSGFITTAPLSDDAKRVLADPAARAELLRQLLGQQNPKQFNVAAGNVRFSVSSASPVAMPGLCAVNGSDNR